MDYSKETRTKRRRRETIVSVAMDMFHEKGIAATTMHDIATDSNIGRSTIYEYFSSKDELLKYIRSLYLETMYTDNIDVDPYASGREQIRSVLKTYFKNMLLRPKTLIFLMEYIRYHEAKDSIDRLLTLPDRQSYKELSFALEKGRLDGTVHKEDLEKKMIIIVETLLATATRYALKERYEYSNQSFNIKRDDMMEVVDYLIDGI